MLEVVTSWGKENRRGRVFGYEGEDFWRNFKVDRFGAVALT